MSRPTSNIEIISASAGSGKTYRLSEELKKAVLSTDPKISARPEAVLATTFTRKASAELRERVRRHLLEAGKAAEAVQLNAALMGTVNSVCGRIVSDFAFSLGLPPDIRVLDEEQAAIALKKALSSVFTEESREEIARISGVFYEWDVEETITKIVDLVRSNYLSLEALKKSRDRCLAEIGSLLGPPLEDEAAEKVEKTIMAAIADFKAEVEHGEDKTKTTKEALDRAVRFLLDLQNRKRPKWQDWNGMANLSAAKKSADAAQKIAAPASSYIHHPRFRADLQSAIALAFDLAAQSLETYSEYKKRRGFIDFTDQEYLALELLDKPEVREYLSDRLDLVLIDEFQDTSPIQLAIFLRLASIAKRSIWVGDQKQSIFGFRGSDPELMNAAIEEIVADSNLTTLPYSWRSRPELVELTSRLFAQAFPRHGIPADRVILDPAPENKNEPPGLGPIIERWIPVIEGRSNVDKRMAALAAGIKECLNDPTVLVRDRETKIARPVKPGDVAVLCRKNSTTYEVAAKLAGLGIRSAQVRPGLLATPEARLGLSALRLWVDPRNALAAAEIARLIDNPEDPDRWLSTLIENPGLAAFKDHPAVSAILASSAAERSNLGVLAAIDRVIDLLGARDICRRWSDPARRLANLDSLRAQARQFTGQSADAGAGMTPAGLIAFFSGLADTENDVQAFNPDSGAVVTSTWHKAKGLEWPIVVLYELESDFSRISFEPRILSDKKKIDLSDPLAGRWIRFWPNPFHGQTKKTPYHELLAGHPSVSETMEVEKRESLRLLYVGWTRARDRVVVACQQDKLGTGMFEEFNNGDSPVLSEPENGTATWGGKDVGILIRQTAAAEPIPSKLESVPTYDVPGPREHAPAYGWPEKAGRIWKAGKPEILGSPIPLKSRAVEMNNLGNAVHGFLAAYTPEMSQEDQAEMAQGLLKRWQVEAALSADDLIEIGNRFRRWVDGNWPGAVWHHEWPIIQRHGCGTMARGVADLILETSDGLVIIDHKAYDSDEKRAKELALEVGEQLGYYSDAGGEAVGKEIVGMYVHFPVMGRVVEIGT